MCGSPRWKRGQHRGLSGLGPESRSSSAGDEAAGVGQTAMLARGVSKQLLVCRPAGQRCRAEAPLRAGGQQQSHPACGPRARRPPCWAWRRLAACHTLSEDGCPHRSMTAWIATAVASSRSPRRPAWKRGSGRSVGTPRSCGWSTSWYVPSSPQTGVFLSPSEDAVSECQRSGDPGVPNPVLFSSRTLHLDNI